MPSPDLTYTSPPETSERSLPALGRVPLELLTGLGEKLATEAAALLAAGGAGRDDLARLERWGLQLQEISHVIAQGGRLRRERVDLGLALLQTLAEWSAEANRLGVELHGPAISVEVETNPAALKHLLDLLLDHGMQQGHSLRVEIETEPDAPFVRVVAHADCAPASSSPERDTLAWQLLVLLARSLTLVPERHAVPGGERVVLPLPRGAAL